MKQRKGFVALPILILLTALVVGAAGYVMFFGENFPDQIACTMEAKLCPDGSAVGRTGPNCEFAACPGEDLLSPERAERVEGLPPVDISDWQTYRNEEYGFEVKYPSWYESGSPISQYGADTIHFFDEEGNHDVGPRFQISVDTDVNGGADVLTVLKFQPEKVVSGPQDIFVANVPAKKYKIVWEYEGREQVYSFVSLELGGRIYTFNDSSEAPSENLFNQILSTFRFLEPAKNTNTPSLQQSNITTESWISYVNSKYLFGFKYPDGHIPYIAIDKESQILLPAGASADRLVIAEDQSLIFEGEPKTLEFNVIQEDISMEEWLAGNSQRYIASSHVISAADFRLAGKSAIEILSDGAGGSAYRIIIVKPGNFSIAIVQSAKSDFLDEVLKTFTFDVQSLR